MVAEHFHFPGKSRPQASKMAEQIQVSTTTPDNLNSTPETSTLEGGNQLLQGDL